MITKISPAIYTKIRSILESAKTQISRSVNTTQVMAYWFIGQTIIEEEQQGKSRANYGDALISELSKKMSQEFGRGWSVRTLEYCRRFFLVFPSLLAIHQHDSGSGASPTQINAYSITNAVRAESLGAWKPGNLHPNLSWTHYRLLLKIEKNQSRQFYEIEAIKNNWSARELERQINSLLFERLALSKDKSGLMRLATKGQEIQKPTDLFKDPVVMEFLGLPKSTKLVESKREEALINNLQGFLLELGSGFAFVSRQERITLDGDHFYIDLVFYHTVLKCYVLIDLKTGKLTHQDLGQLQFYANYFDEERCTEGDQPTLGLILCTDKNDAVVKYTLGNQASQNIFASRYQLYLPTEKELEEELIRETRQLYPSSKKQAKPKPKNAPLFEGGMARKISEP